jgi:uncharacterized protein YbjQ (UPF0145 family)
MKYLSIVGAAAALSSLVVATPFAAQAGAAGPSTVAVFQASAAESLPAIRTVIGSIHEHFCRKAWDPPASDAEALQPLKDRARALGANGLIDVRIDRRHAEPKSACWQRITVTGTAVVFAATPPP